MIDAAEKQVLLEQKERLSKHLLEGPFRGDLFSKALLNYVKRTMPSHAAKLQGIDAVTVTSDVKALEHMLSEAIEYIISVATEEVEYGAHYTTGQLAKMFGVSITTINNWLKEGRFVGVEARGRHKQTRVSESARWRSPNGEMILVREIADKYEQQQKAASAVSPYQELKEMVDAIVFYEKKYGVSSYEEFLMREQLDTPEKERDAQEWKYLLRTVNSEREE